MNSVRENFILSLGNKDYTLDLGLDNVMGMAELLSIMLNDKFSYLSIREVESELRRIVGDDYNPDLATMIFDVVD